MGADSATDGFHARGRQSADEFAAEDGAPDEDHDMDTGFVGIMEESVGDFVGGLLLQQLGGAWRRYKMEHRTSCSRIIPGMYSPPRVTAYLSRFPNKDLLPGFALDLTCTDPSGGQPWDFEKRTARRGPEPCFANKGRCSTSARQSVQRGARGEHSATPSGTLKSYDEKRFAQWST